MIDSSIRGEKNMFRHKTNRRCREGATTVEFAFVAPAVLLLVFVCFEFLRVQMMQNMADIASYEACRFVMVPGADLEEGVAEAGKYLNFLGTRNVTVTVTPFEDGVAQSDIDDYTTEVQVEIGIPIRGNSVILSQFFGNGTIESSTTLAFEGYTGFYDGGN